MPDDHSPLRVAEFEGNPDDAGLLIAPCRFYSAFSPEECLQVSHLGQQGRPVRAGLVRPIEDYRVGDARQIDPTPQTQWIFERLTRFLAAANRWYRFEIRGMREPLLYCEYPTGGRFGWHIDCGQGEASDRKISLSVQLSDEGEYVGGALEFALQGELDDSRDQGNVIAFPSFVPHRVEPVTAGVRRSLVAWAYGPAFR